MVIEPFTKLNRALRFSIVAAVAPVAAAAVPLQCNFYSFSVQCLDDNDNDDDGDGVGDNSGCSDIK